jgi:hypothetical protein
MKLSSIYSGYAWSALCSGSCRIAFKMKKAISILIIIVLSALPVSGAIENKPFRLRTDRHNNPTAMIWTPRVEAFFRSHGYAVKKGDPFPNNTRYHTLDMNQVSDPVKATIEYIDEYSFYNYHGIKRWLHTAMSQRQWLSLTRLEKRYIIYRMYNHENGTTGVLFISRKKTHESEIETVPIARRMEKTDHKRVIFSKTFTERDLDRDGNIKAFTWNDQIKAGDRIEVIAKLPEKAKEIYIYRGPNRTPKWKTTTNGHFRGTVEHVPIGKFYYIWLEKGKGIEARVVITRPS